MALDKTGAAALDEIVLGMTADPLDRVRQLLKEGENKEAARLVDELPLSVSDLDKLAQEIENQISQSEDEVSPPASTVDSEHDTDENTDKGEPHAGEPVPAEAEINEVEGETGEPMRSSKQIKEEAEPPAESKSASLKKMIAKAYMAGAEFRINQIKKAEGKGGK